MKYLFSISKTHFYNIPKIFNVDNITNQSNKDHNEKWTYITDHPYRMLITGGSTSGKPNALLHLIKEQEDIEKI